MAQIRLDLSQFKASGVYTIEYDQSQSIVLNTQTTRLVVGFSKVGPINAPVFCQDVKTAQRIFGPIDTTLEARGSFFHRSLFTCLETGPCFALNLVPLNDDVTSSNPDYDVFKSFSLSTTEPNGATVSKLYSSYFNKQKFFFPDTTYFLANVDDSVNAGKILSFVNLGQVPFSVIVRKTGDLTGFNVTARDWFGAGKVPNYIREYDYISEYFVQIDIVQGDWTNIAQLSNDPVYSQYFNSKGLIQANVQSFLNSSGVNNLGSFQGCLIPDLIDANGVNYSIDVIINNNVATTGLFVTLDRNALSNYDPTDTTSAGRIDMVGHTLIGNSSVDNIDFLSYFFTAKDQQTFSPGATFSPFLLDLGPSASSFLPGATGYSATASGMSLNDTSKVAYFRSFYGTGNQGKFNNLLYIRKDLLSVDQQAHIENLTVGSSLLTNDSGSLTPSDNFAIVSSFFAGQDNGHNVYIIGIASPAKATEGTTPGKHSPVLSSDSTTITVSGTAAGNDINLGDYIFTANAGVRYYWRATSVGITGGNTVITVDTTDNGAPNNVPINSFFTAYWESINGVAGSLYDVISPNSVAEYAQIEAPDATVYVGATSSYYLAYPFSSLYEDFKQGILASTDVAYVAGPIPLYLSPSFQKDSNGEDTLKLSAYYDSALSIGYTGSWNFSQIKTSAGASAGGDLLIYSIGGGISETFSAQFNATHTKAYISPADQTKIQVGQYLVADPTNSGDPSTYVLTRIVSVKKITSGSFANTYEVAVNQPLANYGSYTQIQRFIKIQEAAPTVQFSYYPGFLMGAFHLPGTPAQLAKILGLLDPANANISSGLIDRNVLVYRYIVDTFGGGLAAQSFPKNYLSKLAMSRQQCMALVNAPSINDFIRSTDPRFTDVPTNVNPVPVLNTSYIPTGGNLSLGPSFQYSLPDINNGSQYAGFFAPWLVIRDGNKNITIPPAADVSNNFIRKFINGQPYSIVAGPRRGVLSNPAMVSLEYDFSDDDRGNLEPFGWNPIVYRSNVGFMIYGNQSAYQTILSAFNNLHVRDLLITIESAVQDILGNYVFEFNDATTRLEIKSIVDKFLDNVQSAGGIYAYQSVMDTTNNTPDIIDQNFAIIDIGIEPARGAQKFINRITVLRTGAISSGGFSVA